MKWLGDAWEDYANACTTTDMVMPDYEAPIKDEPLPDIQKKKRKRRARKRKARVQKKKRKRKTKSKKNPNETVFLKTEDLKFSKTGVYEHHHVTV